MTGETPSFVPHLSYRDGRAAIDFVTRAFGLELAQGFNARTAG